MKLISMLLGIALLALSPFTFSQTYSVSLDGYAGAGESGEFFRLLDDDGAWRGGAFVNDGEVVVSNGALENSVGSLSGLLVIKRDGILVSAVDVTIHDGCGYVWHDGALGWAPVDRRAAAWASWYYAGGPEDPDLEIARAWDWGGPNPDPSDAGATGSSRVAWGRWALGIAIQHMLRAGEEPSAAQWAEAYRWGAIAPWDRAQNYHHALVGACCTPTGEAEGQPGRRFVALNHPEAVSGWGYRAAGGIGATLYGRAPAFGRTGPSPGKNWVDRQHGDQAGTVWVAAAMGSWAARRSALNLCETHASQSQASDWRFPNSRAIGWPVRSLALTYKLTADPGMLELLDVHAARQTELRGSRSGGAGGSGNRFFLTEHAEHGGHLQSTPAFDAYASGLGLTGEQYAEALEWDSSWMGSIAGLSYLMAADATAGTGLGPDGKNRTVTWRGHAKWAALMVFKTHTAPGLNIKTMEWGSPGWDYLHIDNARSANSNVFSDTRKTGKQEFDFVFGVAAGTILPFGEEFVRAFPHLAKHITPTTDGVAEVAYREGWWGAKTPDRFLLDRAHTWTGRVGWHGKGWDPDS